MRNLLCSVALVLLLVTSARAQAPSFSSDSALAHLKVLASDIGPRPMGSPAEQRAMAYAVERFKAYGCTEAYIMPMTVAEGVNTRSGIAVGVLKGTTGRIVVIGGHIDSSGPDIPGANDDGSGSACVLELARILGQARHQSTLVFCCWGGEEEGLRGSTYFVDHYALIDSVALMLQLDMADGAGVLEVDPDGPYQQSAPAWLVQAAFDVFYRELGYNGLIYASGSATINYSGKGGYGSDHMPFVAKGIPAVDFTSDTGYPIHTPLDDLHHFAPSGLRRSGDLVLRLFERFDGGVPSRGTEQYWLTTVGTVPIFLYHGTLTAVVIIAGILAVGACIFVMRKRQKPEQGSRIRWSGAKLLLVTIIVQACIWLSPRVVSLVNGYRFPWVNNFTGFVLLGLAAGAVGVWLSINMVRRLRLSVDPYPFYVRALVLLLIFMGLMTFVSIEVGAYGAASIILLVCAMAVRARWAKVVFLAASPYPLFRLIFSESLTLIQRGLASVTLDSMVKIVLYDLGFILLFVLLSLPYVYAFAGVYRETGYDLLWLRRFRIAPGLAGALTLCVVLTIWLSQRPVYDAFWAEGVRIQQRYIAGEDSSTITVSSPEFLRGVHLSYDGRDTVIHDATNTFQIVPGRADSNSPAASGRAPQGWCTIEATTEERPSATGADTESVSLVRRLSITTAFRPLSISVVYTSRSPLVAESPWAMGGRRLRLDSPRARALSWYAFPDTHLIVPVTLTAAPGSRITEEIEVVFDSLAYPVIRWRPATFFTPRTVIVHQDSLRVKRAGEDMASDEHGER